MFFISLLGEALKSEDHSHIVEAVHGTKRAKIVNGGKSTVGISGSATKRGHFAVVFDDSLFVFVLLIFVVLIG